VVYFCSADRSPNVLRARGLTLKCQRHQNGVGRISFVSNELHQLLGVQCQLLATRVQAPSAGQAVTPMIKDMVWAAIIALPDEEAEIRLMLLEYDRDGRITI
jgi:hypothetical protein